MKQPDEIRREVAHAYTQSVNTPPSKRGCCGGEVPVQKGVVVKLGGYTREELSALPPEAVINSFGCGNPVAMAGLEVGNVVLDLGSGAGIDLFLAAKRVGPEGRAIGIDMTDEMIAKVQENIRVGGYTNVEVRKGIIEDLPVENSSVDWVISNCVINLSPEKPRVFREIARVLRPGGRMLVSDIVAQDLPTYIREHSALYASCIAGAISEEEYVAGLKSAGLVDVEIRDRLHYDATQLRAFAGSELEGCCGGGIAKEQLEELSRSMVGKIWSVKVYARKPDVD